MPVLQEHCAGFASLDMDAWPSGEDGAWTGRRAAGRRSGVLAGRER
jgi:hypothetical protein